MTKFLSLVSSLFFFFFFMTNLQYIHFIFDALKTHVLSQIRVGLLLVILLTPTLYYNYQFADRYAITFCVLLCFAQTEEYYI